MHLYVGSIGHEDCDPLATVVALSAEAVQAALDRIEAEEMTDFRNSACDADCADDCEHLADFNMWQTPPAPEGALFVMRHVLGVNRQFGNAPAFLFDDLRAGEPIYV